MNFDAYRWEDHVPRNGSWKFNLAVAALAVGLIATALPDDGGRAASFADRTANVMQRAVVHARKEGNGSRDISLSLERPAGRDIADARRASRKLAMRAFGMPMQQRVARRAIVHRGGDDIAG